MRAITLEAFGDPRAVIKFTEIEEPASPGPGEVLIGVEYAPLDHHDLLLARGTYPTLPDLPSVIGHEGVGTVLELGEGVAGLKPGDPVLVPYGTYAWAERVLAPADRLEIVSPGIDLRQASMLRINPSTAGLLLRRRADLGAGSWVALNAGNSGVGRSLIALAADRGLRTVVLVRREELFDELQAIGADIVVLASDDGVSAARSRIGEEPVLLALDGVAGAATRYLVDLLSPGGTLVNYAVMSGEGFSPDPDAIAAGDVDVEGFYMYSAENEDLLPEVLADAQRLMAAGKIVFPVAGTYAPEEVDAALTGLERGGKVLFDFNPART